MIMSLLLCLAQQGNALPLDNNAPDILDNLFFKHVAVSEVVYGIGISLVGFIFLFFGIRLFRTVVGMAGFSVGALLSYILLINLQESHSFGPHANLITIVICIGAGLLGATIALWAWMVALLAVGGLGGFTLAIYLLSWNWPISIASYLDNKTGRPIFISSLTAIGAAFALIFEQMFVVFGTAIAGAVGVSSGVDVFANTGFNRTLHAILVNRNKIPHRMDGSVYTLLGSCTAIAAIGMMVQYSFVKKKRAFTSLNR